MMDIRGICWAGYIFEEVGGAGETVIPINVCNPNFEAQELGIKILDADIFKVKLATSNLKPSLTISSD